MIVVAIQGLCPHNPTTGTTFASDCLDCTLEHWTAHLTAFARSEVARALEEATDLAVDYVSEELGEKHASEMLCAFQMLATKHKEDGDGK